MWQKGKKRAVLAIAGGGPTSVEIACMISEMIKSILKEGYPELQGNTTQIYLIAANNVLLMPMSKSARQYAYHQFTDMLVEVKLNMPVKIMMKASCISKTMLHLRLII